MSSFTQSSQSHSSIRPIHNRIDGVFVHVSNMERSVNWYHRLFDRPERSSATDKVHSIAMDGGSDLILDQHGYDRGLAVDDRPQLMLHSPDVHAAYRRVKQLGLPVEWEIEEYPGMAFFTLRDPDGNLLMICGQPGSKEEEERSGGPEPIRYDGGGTWLTVSDEAPHSRLTAEGLELTGRAMTKESYPCPLRMEAVLRLEGGSLRLLLGEHGQVTFNYGPSSHGGVGDECYIHHPSLPKMFSYPQKGSIPNGQWVRVEWILRERSMEVYVDGQLFHAQQGYFGDAAGHAGIRCDNGKVTVRSFFLEPLAAEQQVPRLAVASQSDELTPDAACHPAMTEQGLWLAPTAAWGYASTAQSYRVPWECRTVVRADTGSLMLYGDTSLQVKFHPSGDISVADASGPGQEVWFTGKGKLSADGMSEVLWKVEENRLMLTVDGEPRVEHQGHYGGGRYRVGIGPDQGSALTVHSFDIRLL